MSKFIYAHTLTDPPVRVFVNSESVHDVREAMDKRGKWVLTYGPDCREALTNDKQESFRHFMIGAGFPV